MAADLVVGVVDPARTRELRRSVLRPDTAPGARLPGDDLPQAVHLGAWDQDTVVGTCFVFPEPCPWRPDELPAWHLRQMATAPDHRGQGVGAAVLRAAIGHVRAQHARLLWCNARHSAVGFYARHGFTGHGEIFLDAEHPIPHLHMALPLSFADAVPGAGTEPFAGPVSS